MLWLLSVHDIVIFSGMEGLHYECQLIFYGNVHNDLTRYAQTAQTSADPEDPDFGLWTPGSEA